MGATELGFLSAIKGKLAKRYTATGGTISANDLVAINGDEVYKVSSGEIVAPDVFESAATKFVAVCEIDTNKIAIAYQDDANLDYGTCVICTTDGSSWTIGTPVVFESAGTHNIDICKIDTNKIAVVYADAGNSYHGTCILATVSGTVPSFGSAVVFESATSADMKVTLPSSGKIAVSYRDDGNSSYGTCIIATISGTVPSFGSAVVFESAGTYDADICNIDTDKVAISYRDSGNGSYGTCIVATISGTVPSFGSAVVFESAIVDYTSICKIDTDKIAIAYQDEGNSDYGTCIVATISGTVPSFGSAVVFESAGTQWITVESQSTNNITVAYQDQGNSNYGTYITANISGTVPTFGTATVFESATINYPSIAVLGASNIAIAYTDNGNSSYGTVVEIGVGDEDNINGVALSGESTNNRYVAVQPILTA